MNNKSKSIFSRVLPLVFLLFSAKTAYADYGTVILHKATEHVYGHRA